MSGDKVACLCLAGVFGLLVLWAFGCVLHGGLENNQHLLWPRGLRWFPSAYLAVSFRMRRLGRRILWPETAGELPSPRTRYLERLDLQWREACRKEGSPVPVWRVWPNGRGGTWERLQPPEKRCPCGYTDECGIWCGYGHTDGRCPTHDNPLGLPDVVTVLQPGEEVRRIAIRRAGRAGRTP